MLNTELNQSVATLALENPSWVPCFESLQIDYCCHGKATLEQACQKLGLDPHVTLAKLHEHDVDNEPAQIDPASLDVGDLVDHIVNVHHVYLRKQLPLLNEQLNRVANKHGQHHPELKEMETHFKALRDELEQHMLKEELVLFPWAKRQSEPSPTAFSIAMPISCMEREHEFAGRMLENLRSLSGGYAVPDDACTTYRLLMIGLADMEKDLHQHIHKENNILFPRLLTNNDGVPESLQCNHHVNH